MNCSTPGLPVHHQLPEFTQTLVHWVGDAIQPSPPLSSPSPPSPIPPSIRVFSNESALCMRWPKYWSFSFSIIPSKEIPGLISFRWLPLSYADMGTETYKEVSLTQVSWIERLGIQVMSESKATCFCWLLYNASALQGRMGQGNLVLSPHWICTSIW